MFGCIFGQQLVLSCLLLLDLHYILLLQQFSKAPLFYNLFFKVTSLEDNFTQPRQEDRIGNQYTRKNLKKTGPSPNAGLFLMNRIIYSFFDMFDGMMNRIYASYFVDILGSTEEKSAQVEQVSSSAQS